MIQGCTKCITFYLLFFLISHQSFSQYPKRANLAVIKNDSLTNLLLLNKCINILEKEGYEICKNKPEHCFCTTMACQVDDLPVLVYYTLSINDNIILLRGYIMDNRDYNSAGIKNTRREWERSACRSFTGCLWKTGFEDMTRLAEKIRRNLQGVVSWRVEYEIEI